MSTAHRDALASAGLIVDDVLTGLSGYSPFADLLRAAAAEGTALVARDVFDAWTAAAKATLPQIREDVAAWVARLVDHVGVLYELAAAEATDHDAATPARLHGEYLRAFVGYLTPQETAGMRPKGVGAAATLEILAAQALGIRDAVTVERGEVVGCEHDEVLPRDAEGLMFALGLVEDEDGESGDKTPTVN